MYAGGSIELLLTKVDTRIISLVGRWCSDIMMRYLHAFKQSFTAVLVSHMVQHRYCALIPPPMRAIIPIPLGWAPPSPYWEQIGVLSYDFCGLGV